MKQRGKRRDRSEHAQGDGERLHGPIDFRLDGRGRVEFVACSGGTKLGELPFHGGDDAVPVSSLESIVDGAPGASGRVGEDLLGQVRG